MCDQTQDKPRFSHDCDRCNFLGRIGQFDVYCCPQHGNPTVVARSSSLGPDYASWPLHLLKSNRNDLKNVTPDFVACLLAIARRCPTNILLFTTPVPE